MRRHRFSRHRLPPPDPTRTVFLCVVFVIVVLLALYIFAAFFNSMGGESMKGLFVPDEIR